jgi:hypothetical protein
VWSLSLIARDWLSFFPSSSLFQSLMAFPASFKNWSPWLAQK